MQDHPRDDGTDGDPTGDDIHGTAETSWRDDLDDTTAEPVSEGSEPAGTSTAAGSGGGPGSPGPGGTSADSHGAGTAVASSDAPSTAGDENLSPS